MIAGFDPGLNGAIVVLDQCHIANFVSWRLTGQTVKHARAHILEQCNKVLPQVTHLACEAVGSRPGEGASRAHRFGWARGLVEGQAHARGIKVVPVPPHQWKRNLGLYNPDKKFARHLAWKFFDRHFKANETDIAEAALMALWLSYKLAGNPRVLQ